MKKKSIVTSALILTLAGIITRIMGFVYRIYMSNIIGAEGMGLYQLIMPVYSLAWSIACSGFTTTVSKLTAQERAKGEHGNMSVVLKLSVMITTCLGSLLCVLLFLFAEPVAIYFLKDARAAMPLKIVSLSLPFMAAGTCLRSYFMGLQEMVVPAVNQVLEQCVRMLVIYFLAGFFIPRGLEYACAVAVIGIVCEEFASFIYIYLSYKRYKTKNLIKKRPSLTNGQALTLIFSMALPLTLNRVTGSFLSAFENTLIPQRLLLSGLTQKEAMITYGQITGMAMPLISFPSALLMAISMTLVPSVSELMAVKNYKRIGYTVSRAILFAAIVGIGAAAIFIAFPDKLGYVIYRQHIGPMLLTLGIMCPFLYMQQIFSGVLNGMGFQVFIFRNSILSSVINIIFIYFLVPRNGIYAFILGWFVSLVLICALEIDKIRKSIDLDIQYANWFIKPVLSGAAAGLAVKWLGGRYIFPLLGDLPGLIAAVCLLVVLYTAFILMTGCLSDGDLDMILRGLKIRKTVTD